MRLTSVSSAIRTFAAQNERANAVNRRREQEADRACREPDHAKEATRNVVDALVDIKLRTAQTIIGIKKNAAA